VASNASGAGAPPADGSAAAGEALSRKRAAKEKWQEGIALFNSKPKKGIALLQVSSQGADVFDVKQLPGESQLLCGTDNAPGQRHEASMCSLPACLLELHGEI